MDHLITVLKNGSMQHDAQDNFNTIFCCSNMLQVFELHQNNL